MTVVRAKITGGPANDVGLASWAKVLRFAYGTGLVDSGTTDEDRIEAFGAFLAGHDRPPKISTRPT